MPSTEAEIFRTAVARRMGLRFGDDKLAFLDSVLERRVRETGRDCLAYLAALSEGRAPDELDALAESLAVTETYFFRHGEQFRALATEVLARRPADSPPRLLSAACSSGEEPYSLAMLLEERFPAWLEPACVRAVDLHPLMLRAAARGVYTAWALRETPAAMRERHFTPVGDRFRIRDGIRAAVRFERRNLAEPNDDLWRPGSYDVVFCRNLFMYLDPEAAALLAARVARALVPGGCLFLGHAESLRGLSRDFAVRQAQGAFFYERLAGRSPGAREAAPPSRTASLDWDLVPAAVPASPAPEPDSVPVPARDPAPIPDQDAGWFAAIGRSSRRVRDLAARGTRTAAEPGAGASGPDLAPVHALMERERYGEALDALESAARDRGWSPRALLTRAALLAHSGRLEEARVACVRLLRRPECRAGAHHIMALCHEQAGDPAAAAEQDQAALRLDPAFALPVLHLGLLARRRGDAAGARGCFERALPLLEREDPSRVLLFGGGFTRRGLIQICLGALDPRGAAR